MEGARITRLLCEISILKYCLLNELFEKWRIPPPLSPSHVTGGGSSHDQQQLSGPVHSEPSRTTMYPCMSTFSARNFMQIYALYRGVIWIFCTQVVKNLILGGKQFFSPLY